MDTNMSNLMAEERAWEENVIRVSLQVRDEAQLRLDAIVKNGGREIAALEVQEIEDLVVTIGFLVSSDQLSLAQRCAEVTELCLGELEAKVS